MKGWEGVVLPNLFNSVVDRQKDLPSCFRTSWLGCVMAWLIVIVYAGGGKNTLKLSLQVLLSGGGGG